MITRSPILPRDAAPWPRVRFFQPWRHAAGRWGPCLLLGMVLQAAPLGAQEISLRVKEFRVEGNNPLSGENTRAVLGKFLGEHRDLAGLEAAADALEQEIRRHGNSFGRVILPAQVPEEGIVTLQVVDFKLGKVLISGNRHFSTDNIQRSLPDLRVDSAPDTRQVSQNLAVANEHPAKRLKLAMKPGDTPNTLNAEVAVQEESPITAFVSATNTGNDETGKARLSLGAQHSNLFDRDHVIQAIYTTSPTHSQAVRQYGLTYQIPWYDVGATWSLFLTKSDVDSGVIGEFFNVTGKGDFAGIRYQQQWPNSLAGWGQLLGVELEHKRFTNSIAVIGGLGSGSAPLRSDLTTLPVSVKYELRQTGEGHKIALFAQLSANTGGSSLERYGEVRPGSRKNWNLWRIGMDSQWAITPGWTATVRYRTQQSRDALVSGEQFGIGGSSSVRGFKERETAGDTGHQLNLELTTPRLGAVQPVVFIDAGTRHLNNEIAETPRNASIASAGIGLRWAPFTDTSVSVDIAHVVKGIDNGTKNGQQKAHLAVFHRF